MEGWEELWRDWSGWLGRLGRREGCGGLGRWRRAWCQHGIPKRVSVRPRHACPCVLACSAAGSWKCLVNHDTAVCWRPFRIPSLADPFPRNRPAAGTEPRPPGSGKPPGAGRPSSSLLAPERLEKPPTPTCSSRLIPVVWKVLEFGKAACAMTLGRMCLPLHFQLIPVGWEQPARCPRYPCTPKASRPATGGGFP